MKQGGFLLIAAIVLLVVLSFFALVVTDLFVGDTRGSTYHLASAQALFLAEAGLQRATHTLLSPTVMTPSSLDNRQSCATVNTNLTHVPLGAGVFSVTGGNPFYSGDATNPAMTVRGALSATATLIPLSNTASLADYAPAGRAMIDREEINYSAISQSASVCGTSACLIGVTRGVDGTPAVVHSSGTPVGQYQCTVQSQGGVPMRTNARGKRTLGQGIELQEGWAVGSVNQGVPTLLRWTGTAWVDVTTSLPPFLQTQGLDLNSVRCLSYADCWAVGSMAAGAAVAVHWDGSRWVSVPLPTHITNNGLDLDDVSCVSATDCWIAGSAGAKWLTVLYWNGSVWTDETGTALASLVAQTGTKYKKWKKRDLESVNCQDAGAGVTQCWFVGSLNQGSTTVVRLVWNVATQTGTWTDYSGQVKGGLRNNDIDAVTCLSATRCWGVGSDNWGQAAIIYWNGANWSVFSVLRNSGDVENIACTDPANCWASGSASGGGTLKKTTLLHWNGTTWSDVTNWVPRSIWRKKRDLEGIACGNSDDCWIVGSIFRGSATAMHWNGTAWTDFSASVPNGNDVEAIYMVSPGAHPRAAWQELFP